MKRAALYVRVSTPDQHERWRRNRVGALLLKRHLDAQLDARQAGWQSAHRVIFVAHPLVGRKRTNSCLFFTRCAAIRDNR